MSLKYMVFPFLTQMAEKEKNFKLFYSQFLLKVLDAYCTINILKVENHILHHT